MWCRAALSQERHEEGGNCVCCRSVPFNKQPEVVFFWDQGKGPGGEVIITIRLATWLSTVLPLKVKIRTVHAQCTHDFFHSAQSVHKQKTSMRSWDNIGPSLFHYYSACALFRNSHCVCTVRFSFKENYCW